MGFFYRGPHAADRGKIREGRPLLPANFGGPVAIPPFPTRGKSATLQTRMSEISSKRILIFVVAYNAEKTIQSVLGRIPRELHSPNVEVLVIDDFSKDRTFAEGINAEALHQNLKITMLRTPENQGYGGNQKLGYRYAIEHGFDIVALVHGDGQYAPEKLPALIGPFLRGEADAVFGSRMIHKQDALKGGMPLYKWLGNQVLTRFENRMLGTRLSEFHSGYRLYSVEALRKIPFERNSNDFHFDTEIIIQLQFAGLRIVELPIPTFYGDEICHVNGLKYAWDIFRTMVRAQAHRMFLFYDRKFDIAPPEENYTLKTGFPSSHTMAVEAVEENADVLDLGCGRGYVAAEMAKRARHVTSVDRHPMPTPPAPNVAFIQWDLDSDSIPFDASRFDQIFLLDIIEHLRDPEGFMEKLRASCVAARPEVIITTANIGFIVTRLMLLLGQFNYGRRGILDRTHTRLFTFNSLRELLEQAGYNILETRGIPAPFPHAIGDNRPGHLLVRLNSLLILLNRRLFSYQMFIRAQAQPTVRNLLAHTTETTRVLRGAIGQVKS
jgi:glycosyltransferase involved in cell wall biosynthesis